MRGDGKQTLWISTLLAAIRPVAEEAGRATLAFYGDHAGAREKADGSPVTLADEAAEAVILPALRALTPEIPVVSEEEAAKGLGPTSIGARFWLVDPLDGTKEFLNGNGEFTVNIALIENDRPVLGVVHVPALDTTYAGAGLGTATRQDGAGKPYPIAARAIPGNGAVLMHSRSHADEAQIAAYAANFPGATRRASGSSIKFCLVAEGEADVYPRLGPTMEWDTAAAHAVLDAAGGRVTTLDGARLTYRKPQFRNPHFVAQGSRARD